MLFLVALTIVCCWGESEALVPRQCVSNATVGDAICCPIPRGFDAPCGGQGRGICEKIYIHRENVIPQFVVDDRVNWPTRFFKSACRCLGNFFGVACDECWFGWEGKNCDQKRTIVRRNIFSYTAKEKEMFVRIVAASKQVMTDYMVLIETDNSRSDPVVNPIFEPATIPYYIAYLHRYASRSTLFKSPEECKNYGFLDFNHDVEGFLTWHRYFMLWWERQLKKIAIDLFGWKDFAIPYWDWVDAESCEVCTNDLVGAPGPLTGDGRTRLLHPASPFSTWTEYCSPPKSSLACHGCHSLQKPFPPLNRNYVANKFPLTEDLLFTLSLPIFTMPDERKNMTENCRTFHLAMEGFCGRPGISKAHLFMHNKVHNMVDGSFCCSSTASNDPLFILHHSMVDRIFQVWFQRYNPTVTAFSNHHMSPGNCRECNLVGAFPAIKHGQMFTDIRELGILYDNFHFGKKGFDGQKFIDQGITKR